MSWEADQVVVRPVTSGDLAGWLPLWDGYNAFYGRRGPTALSRAITDLTWQRFLEPQEPVFALVAERNGGLVGLAHYLFHRSTTKAEDVCYLQDLFTSAELRGRGIGRKLIEAVYDKAREAGSQRVYWHTQSTNSAGRALYDNVARHLGFIVYSKDL